MKFCDCCISWQNNADPSSWEYWNTPADKVEYAKARLAAMYGIASIDAIPYASSDDAWNQICDVCHYEGATHYNYEEKR